MVHEL